MKYVVKRDSTAFCYIDVNIPSLIESGCGANIIQRSVFLDNETKDNCMIILLGMHHYLELWWVDFRARGLTIGNGFVHKITNQDWTAEDAKKYKTD